MIALETAADAVSAVDLLVMSPLLMLSAAVSSWPSYDLAIGLIRDLYKKQIRRTLARNGRDRKANRLMTFESPQPAAGPQ